MLVIRTARATYNTNGERTDYTQRDSKKMSEREARANLLAVMVTDGATIISRDKDSITFERPCQYRPGYVIRTTIGIRFPL